MSGPIGFGWYPSPYYNNGLGIYISLYRGIFISFSIRRRVLMLWAYSPKKDMR